MRKVNLENVNMLTINKNPDGTVFVSVQYIDNSETLISENFDYNYMWIFKNSNEGSN